MEWGGPAEAFGNAELNGTFCIVTTPSGQARAQEVTCKPSPPLAGSLLEEVEVGGREGVPSPTLLFGRKLSTEKNVLLSGPFLWIILGPSLLLFSFLFLKILFIFRGKERERNIDVLEKRWLTAFCTRPQPGTWPTTQACALTWNWTRTFPFVGPHPAPWAPPVRASSSSLN